MKAWVARDRNGSLWIFTCKPIKDLRIDAWVLRNSPSLLNKVHEELFEPGYFDSVKWEDKEPTECDYWPNPVDDMQYITLKK